MQTTLLAPGTGRNGTERFGDWLVGESGKTQGCQYFLKKDNVCGKVVSMRIGMGYDVHRLVEGRDLIIGGVKIPYEKGLLGHSDADVLLHAIMDALLGAAALGDIGKHFPDNDERYEGADSIMLLRHVKRMLDEKQYLIANIDATIIAQKPKMASFIPDMVQTIAEALSLSENQVNIKATTEEGLGFTGSGEGISSHAICLLETVANYGYADPVETEQNRCSACSGCARGQM